MQPPIFFKTHVPEYVEVLLAQHDLQDAKVVIIETKKQQLTAIVNAYQALGGGMVRSYNSAMAASPLVTFSSETLPPDTTSTDGSNSDRKAATDKANAENVPPVPSSSICSTSTGRNLVPQNPAIHGLTSHSLSLPRLAADRKPTHTVK